MFYIILITVLGISLAPFVFHQVDMWHAQGVWTQCGIALMLAWSFFERPKNQPTRNIPLGLLFLWLSIQVSFICYFVLMKGKYDTAHFFPYFNFLCLILFYKFVTQYITLSQLKIILEGMRWVAITTLFVCVLQIFNISQFFERVDMHHTHNNIVTGFLGNGTHVSGFLATCSPLFFWRMKRVDVLALVLMLLVLLWTGTTIGDPSISGYAIIPALFLFYFKCKPKIIVPCVVLGIGVFILAYPSIPKQFFSFQGRWDIWARYLPFFKTYPMTGAGIGTVHQVYKQIYAQARHLHLEYYQFLIETGIIGLALILNIVYAFIKHKAINRIQLVLKTMVVGFLLSCCFNFPAHLWLPSMYAMFCYAGFNLIKEKHYGCIVEEGDKNPLHERHRYRGDCNGEPHK